MAVRSLKILILHNSYQQAGGEDAVVHNEAGMLRRAGHDVTLKIVSNDAISTFGVKVRAAYRAGFDRERMDWMTGLLDRVRPDIVHVHNFFPLLTPAVHTAASQWGAAVVQTLHNYRLLCAGALLMRDGGICELCLGGSSWPALRHRCYRNSLAGTWAVTRMQRLAMGQSMMPRHVDAFIALSQFARSKFVSGGLPAENIYVKPNFVASDGRPEEQLSRDGFLFVGRLSSEKGVATLIEAWRGLNSISLTVAGDGPIRRQLEECAPDNVRFLGNIEPDRVAQEMRRASALVLPSLCYENFPMAIAEAFANGLPVIASRIGSVAEIVEDGVTGLHFEPGNAQSLRDAVRRFLSEPAKASESGRQARTAFEESYSESRNLTVLENIYESAISTHGSRISA